MRNFTDIYYESVECIRCNLCLDKCPVVRAVGIDKAPMYSAVYSALGSRFDLDYTAKEAFQCIDCYECEQVCPVDVPIVDTMKHVRMLAIEAGKVSESVMEVIEKAKRKENILGTPVELTKGQAEVVLFLGYAGELDQNVVDAFDKICKTANVEYSVISGAADSGYLLNHAGFEADAAAAIEENVKLFKEAAAKVIVTPCSFSYDAFVNLYPDAFEYKHISQFVEELITDGKLTINKDNNNIVYHEANLLTRLEGTENAPNNVIKAISGQAVMKPARSGSQTSASGIGGGLGLFNKNITDKVSKQRAEELAQFGSETVVTDCVFEKYVLKNVLNDTNIKVIDVTELVAQAL